MILVDYKSILAAFIMITLLAEIVAEDAATAKVLLLLFEPTSRFPIILIDSRMPRDWSAS